MNRTAIKIQSTIHRFLYRVSNGRVGSHFFAPVLLLTTTGRKSGQPRTMPLFFLQDGNNWVIVGSNGGNDQPPAWWLNLQANPTAKIQIQDKHFEVISKEARGEDKDRLWLELVKLFPTYAEYRQMTERDIPVVILSPQSVSSTT